MSWVRLDDTFPEHPKVLRAGPEAAWLFVAGTAYCSRNLTDGFIPAAAVRLMTDRPELADVLCEVGLWDVCDHGFMVHDYLEYQPARAEIEAERAKRADARARAGQLGGIASGVARRKHNRSKDEAELNLYGSKPEANGQAETNGNVAPTRPDPITPLPPADSQDDRQRQVVDEYAKQGIAVATAKGVRIGNEDAYGKKLRGAIHVGELDRLLELFPTAPVSVIAAALHGEKHSLNQYPRSDELAPVHELRPA